MLVGQADTKKALDLQGTLCDLVQEVRVLRSEHYGTSQKREVVASSVHSTLLGADVELGNAVASHEVAALPSGSATTASGGKIACGEFVSILQTLARNVERQLQESLVL